MTDKKMLISYFYQIRFFPPNYIPISTAAWDPKWFHPANDKDGVFLHKTGVLYGERIKILSPADIDCDCKKDCEHDPKTCAFLKDYKSYLDKLNFDEVVCQIKNICAASNPTEKEPVPVLIVYEKPDDPCSERHPLMQWFKENNWALEEFSKEKCKS